MYHYRVFYKPKLPGVHVREFSSTLPYWRFIEALKAKGLPFHGYERPVGESNWKSTGEHYLAGVIRIGITSTKIEVVIHEKINDYSLV